MNDTRVNKDIWKFYNISSSKLFVIFVGFMFIPLCAVQAENKLRFLEVGAGISYFSSPHYLGSNQSENYVLPFPHIILKSDVFNVDRSSIEGRVTKSNFFKIDVSFSGRLKVDEGDNRARQGMPGLDYVLEAGPSFKFLMYQNQSKDFNLSFDVPLRGAIATDFSNAETIGWRVVPTINLHQTWRGEQFWELDSQLRYLYDSEKYHDYFYTVEAQYATASRAEYKAQQGGGGVELKVRLKTSYRKMVVGVFAIYTDVSSAVFVDSPLVVVDHDFSMGIFASWIFATKGER